MMHRRNQPGSTLCVSSVGSIPKKNEEGELLRRFFYCFVSDVKASSYRQDEQIGAITPAPSAAKLKLKILFPNAIVKAS